MKDINRNRKQTHFFVVNVRIFRQLGSQALFIKGKLRGKLGFLDQCCSSLSD